jgi:hypothetical protein
MVIFRNTSIFLPNRAYLLKLSCSYSLFPGFLQKSKLIQRLIRKQKFMALEYLEKLDIFVNYRK